MAKKKSSKHKESHTSKEHHHERKEGFSNKHPWLSFIIKFIVVAAVLILLIGGGTAYYFYNYQPDLWNQAADWINERYSEMQSEKNEIENYDFKDVEIEAEPIPEEYFEGHKAEAGDITQTDAESKMREDFEIEEGDVVMSWPEKIQAGEWIWESDMVMGPVGKLVSDGWLFWVDKGFGSMYPHPTYYVVVYGDGYVDVFVGSFTPMIDEDDWLESGTKAKLIQGSIELE